MKIIEVYSLAIPEVKVIKAQRFTDQRGYFTETFRQSDLEKIIPDFKIFQINESFSKKGVIRGLHFQWSPYMGKLVRTIRGHMIDIALDIRLGSPTYGKAVLCDLPSKEDEDFFKAVWVPVGFAHGVFFLEDSLIEYYCTGEYAPKTEKGINPASKNIDWSTADPKLVSLFKETLKTAIISDKDKAGIDLKDWPKDEASKNFIYR